MLLKKVDELELSIRSANQLHQNGIETIADLTSHSKGRLISLGFKKVSVDEIEQQLNEHGLSFATVEAHKRIVFGNYVIPYLDKPTKRCEGWVEIREGNIHSGGVFSLDDMKSITLFYDETESVRFSALYEDPEDWVPNDIPLFRMIKGMKMLFKDKYDPVDITLYMVYYENGSERITEQFVGYISAVENAKHLKSIGHPITNVRLFTSVEIDSEDW